MYFINHKTPYVFNTRLFQDLPYKLILLNHEVYCTPKNDTQVFLMSNKYSIFIT